MKKLFCLLMTLCMMAAVPALAAEDLTGRPLADGVVTAVNYVDVTAPMSGTLTAFDLTAGDAVEAGQTLMGFVTTGIYATEDATVKAVYASEGDDATAAMNRWVRCWAWSRTWINRFKRRPPALTTARIPGRCILARRCISSPPSPATPRARAAL